MRNRYLICYDVADPKRLRRMFRTLHGYGDPIQYSVFICDLAPQERVLMEAAVHDIIHHKEDRVLVVDIGPVSGRGNRAVQQFGRTLALPGQRTAVIV